MHFIAHSRHTLRNATLAAGVALLCSGPAAAVETLYGGGATLPAVPYVGTGYIATNPDARLSTNAGNTAGAGFQTAAISAGSLFASYTAATANKVSYCQTGDGFGKNVLNIASGAAAASGQCKDFRITDPATTPLGFSGAKATPDYIGTDAPYSTPDYNAFLGNNPAITRLGLVQIPIFAGAVALPHSANLANTLALTTSQICRIYSGVIRDWSGIPNSGSTRPIKIVYRTDSNGVTLALTTYLAAKCNGTNDVFSGFEFTPSPVFNTAVPGGASNVYGVNAIGASGDNGVVSTVRVTSDAHGYASIGETKAQASEYALVTTSSGSFDPANFGRDASGAPSPVGINPTTGLLRGKVLDGTVVNNVPGNASDEIKKCVALVNPTATITTTYPIVQITYLAGYYGGNGSATHIQAIKDFYNSFYNPTTRPVLPPGFAYLDRAATFGVLIKNAIVKNCVN